MKIEEMFTNNPYNRFKMFVLEVDPYHVGEVINMVLGDGITYIYDDILVTPEFYDPYGKPHRKISFIVKEDNVDEMLSRYIGRDFIMNVYTLIL